LTRCGLLPERERAEEGLDGQRGTGVMAAYPFTVVPQVFFRNPFR
jgi:hypothetical protein